MPFQAKDYLLVAAIDLGTTYSGYALSFKSSPEEILINKNWGEELGFQSHKAPSTVLTDQSGDFLAFGYEAEKEYSEAVGEGEEGELKLFKHFKMMLHNTENIRRASRVTAPSLDGTDFPAFGVFVHVLRFLKQHLLNTLKDEIARDVDPDMIRWVLTVPAIWRDEAKQFMRQAAFEAGCIKTINSNQLVIALEPEAASLCCRRHNIAQFANSENAHFPPGTKYLVLDCGGGTVDITAHTTGRGNEVKEIMEPSGGPWGSTEVDKNFVHLLQDILGDGFVIEFKRNHPTEWLSFTTNFEKTKKSLKGDGKSRLSVPLTYSMGDFYADRNEGQKIVEAIKGAKGKGVTFSSGNLVIRNDAALKLFDPVIQQIIEHLKDLLQNPDLDDLQYIFMVGGFSECHVLQDAVREAFCERGIRVLIPSSAQLAVIKGAVLFGQTPSEVTARRAKFTYGITKVEPFDENIHNARYQYTNHDGQVFCGQIFQAFVEKGEEVATGDKRTTHFSFGYDPGKGNPFALNLLRLIGKPRKPLQYTDDSRIEQIGFIPLGCLYKKSQCTPPFTVTIEFGGTEILIEVTDDSTGDSVKSTISFLSEK